VNPWELSATELVVWGVVLHLVADWPLQSDWMAQKKSNLRHPAGYVHAGIHGLLFAVIFGWAAIPLAVSHLLIDTRKPIDLWMRMMCQKEPSGLKVGSAEGMDPPIVVVDMGMWVKLMMDQVFHIICVAIAALLVVP
jgi:hypothetical protein